MVGTSFLEGMVVGLVPSLRFVDTETQGIGKRNDFKSLEVRNEKVTLVWPKGERKIRVAFN